MTQPNILWFITDDTTEEMLGFSGAPVLTPNIDSIARNGVTCKNFHTTAPACCPSRYSYLTGLYPGHCPDSRFINRFDLKEPHAVDFNVYINKETPTVAHQFRNAGYRTGFVGKCHTGSERADLAGNSYRPDDDPTDPEVSKKLKEDYAVMQRELYECGFDYADGIAWNNTDLRPIESLQYHNLEWHTDHALRFLDQQKDSNKPFFLHMATTTIHGPHHERSIETDGRAVEWGMLDEMPAVMPDRGTIAQRLTDAGIEVNHRTTGALWTDDAFGAVMKKLDALGLTENTIIIFSTDHGAGVTNGKFTCYQGGVSIPFAMQYPGHIEAGSTCEALIQNIDFFPTMLDFAGLAVPKSIDGISRKAQLCGAQDDRESLFFEWGYCRGVRTKKWKYIAFRPTKAHIDDMKAGKVDRAFNYRGWLSADYPMHHYPHYFEPDQLYDLEHDPDEQHTLAQAPECQEILDKMKILMQGYTEKFKNPFDLTIAPFLMSEEYKRLCQNHLADQSIYEPYYIKEKAY